MLVLSLPVSWSYTTGGLTAPLLVAFKNDLGLTYLQVGNATASFFLGGVVGASALPTLISQLGLRRLAISLSVALGAILLLGTWSVDSWQGLYLMFAGAGAVARHYAILNTYATADPKERDERMFALVAAVVVGQVLVLSIAALLLDDWRIAMTVHAAFVVILGLSVFRWLPDDRPAPRIAAPAALRLRRRVVWHFATGCERAAQALKRVAEREASSRPLLDRIREEFTPAAQIMFVSQATLWSVSTYQLAAITALGLGEKNVLFTFVPLLAAIGVSRWAVRLEGRRHLAELASLVSVALAWPTVGIALLLDDPRLSLVLLAAALLLADIGATVWTTHGPLAMVREHASFLSAQRGTDQSRSAGAVFGILLGGAGDALIGGVWGIQLLGMLLGFVGIWLLLRTRAQRAAQLENLRSVGRFGARFVCRLVCCDGKVHVTVRGVGAGAEVSVRGGDHPHDVYLSPGEKLAVRDRTGRTIVTVVGGAPLG
jgi:MFS family permease